MLRNPDRQDFSKRIVELHMTETVPQDLAELIPLLSHDFLRFLQTQAFAGGWSWTFANHQEVWSPSLVHLCGLPAKARPTYDLMLDLVHPEDRHRLDSRSDIQELGMLGDRTFRIIRPDGILRVLSSRGEVFFNADGQPRSAAALVVDVTDRSPTICSRQARQHRNRGPYWLDAPREAEIRSQGVGAITRCEAQRSPATTGILAGHATTVARDDAGYPGRFGHDEHEPVPAPAVVDGRGERGSASTAEEVRAIKAGWQLVRTGGAGPGILSEHLRAARALLGWSMADLAKASHLSLSTIRRLEDDVHGPTPRNLSCVVKVLQQAGVHFILTERDSIAVGIF